MRQADLGAAPTRLITLAVALLIATAAAVTADVAEEGEPPPRFALADETGRVYDLADYRGTPTLLYFTHNMCHYCTQVIGFLKRTRPLYGEDELAILTINVWADGPKLIERYKEQFGLNFPMLAGKDLQLLHDYEVNYVPIIIFIDRQGLIRHIFEHYIIAPDFDAAVREITAAD